MASSTGISSKHLTKWLRELSEDESPSKEDIEFFVNLGVSSADVFNRLYWRDAEMLTPHISALISMRKSSKISDSESDDVREDPELECEDEQSETSFVEVPNQLSNISSSDSVEQSASVLSIDQREEPLRKYVQAVRASDSSIDWDEAWIENALRDPRKLLSQLETRLARLHGSKLTEILRIDVRGNGAEENLHNINESSFAGVPDPHQEHVARERITIGIGSNGGLRLDWPSNKTTGLTFFKVFTDPNGGRPILFDGRQVGREATSETTIQDSLPEFHDGIQQYAVWAYSGSTLEEAKDSVPVLWAEGISSQGVQDPQVSVRGDDVSAQWKTTNGVDRVEVYRLEDTGSVSRDLIPDQAFLISGQLSGDNLNGFVDSDVPMGSYEYRFYTLRSIGGTHVRSLPTFNQVEISVPVPELTEARVEIREEPELRLDVAWDVPDVSNCHVHIYLRKEPPQQEIEGQELDEQALERAGFSKESRQSFPHTEHTDGLRHIEFDWPHGFDRAYVTFVTQVGTRFRVGQTETQVKASAVSGARIVERVDEQILVFDWPAGADVVSVLTSPSVDEPTNIDEWNHIVEVPFDKHKKYGGVHLEQPLSRVGCHVAIYGIAYHDGKQTKGEPQFLHYPGLVKVRYNFRKTGENLEQAGSRFKLPRLRKAPGTQSWSLHAKADSSIDREFVLVRNLDRIPLHLRDGEAVKRHRLEFATDVEMSLWSDLIDGRDLKGYVRLFVVDDEASDLGVAVLDPRAESLFWKGLS